MKPIDVFDLFAKIILDTSEYESSLDDASKRFQSVGKAISSAGGTLKKAVTSPVVDLGKSVIKTGADYEAGMSRVQAISGATADEMAVLGDEALRMAEQTRFSTAEAAEAYQHMAMAGWEVQDMAGGLSDIMLLAAVSGEKLAATSDSVTEALAAFGLTAADSGRLADVLTAAANSTNTNVSALSESLRSVAPVAGTMGYSVEDVSVALGLMADSGIKAGQAGSSLCTAMTNMAAPTADISAAMETYGISLTDAGGNMLSFAEIMEQLREKLGGLDQATQTAVASQLFGKEAMAGMLAVINAAPADFDRLTESVSNSAGATQAMADVVNGGASGAMTMLNSSIDVLFTNLSQLLMPTLTGIVQKITEVVQWFNSLDESTQSIIMTIAGVVAAVGPVLVILGKVIGAIGSISEGVSKISGVAKELGGGLEALWGIMTANPVAAVATAIAGLVAGFVYLWNTSEEFREFWIGLWEKVKEVVATVCGAIAGFFAAAWQTIKTAWDAAVGFFSGIGDGIVNAFFAVKEALGNFFTAAWEKIQTVWNGAVSFFRGVWDGISKQFDNAVAFFGKAFSGAWKAVTDAWSGVSGFFSGVWESIKGAFSNVWEHFSGIGKDLLSGLWNGITDKIDWLKGKVKGVVDTIKGWFTGKDGFDEHSPSRWSRQVFRYVLEGGAAGLAAGLPGLMSDVESAVGRVKSGLDFGAVPVGIAPAGTEGFGIQGAAARGGDTYNFYSPKALDPVSAAREMKKARQQLVLGLV